MVTTIATQAKTGIQIATKSLPGPQPPVNIGNFYQHQNDIFGYEIQRLPSRVLANILESEMLAAESTVWTCCPSTKAKCHQK